GGFEFAESEFVRQLFDHSIRRLLVEFHCASEEIILVEPAKHEIGVRHSRLTSSPPIGRGARNGACAARADAKGAALIEIGDRSAARADRMDVDHWQEQ